jgi:hypothetical protein
VEFASRAHPRECSGTSANGASICALPELAAFGEQLQRAYTNFTRQQIKVIFYENPTRDQRAVYAKVLTFECSA